MMIYPILGLAIASPMIAFISGMAFENAEHRTAIIWLGVATLMSIAAVLAMAAFGGGGGI